MPTSTSFIDLREPCALKAGRDCSSGLVWGNKERDEKLGVQLQDDRVDVKILIEDFETDILLRAPLLEDNWRLHVVDVGLAVQGQYVTSNFGTNGIGREDFERA